MQVQKQKQLGVDAVLAATPSAAGSKAPTGASAEGQPSLIRVSHSILLVEAWEVVEAGGQQRQREQQQEVLPAGQGAVLSSSNSSGEARPGERSLQAVVTDLPRTDPRQCIFPT